MAAYHLEIRDSEGKRAPFTGGFGPVYFRDGLSIAKHDPGSWAVRRLLSADDGGQNLVPTMRIVHDDPPPLHVPSQAAEKDEAPAEEGAANAATRQPPAGGHDRGGAREYGARVQRRRR